MSLFPSDVKILLALTPIDFRKGPDSLLALVRDSGSDPYNGALYVFRAKRSDRIKIVWWDGSGVCLYTKRLERSGFCWPRAGQARFQLNQAHRPDWKTHTIQKGTDGGIFTHVGSLSYDT